MRSVWSQGERGGLLGEGSAWAKAETGVARWQHSRVCVSVGAPTVTGPPCPLKTHSEDGLRGRLHLQQLVSAHPPAPSPVSPGTHALLREGPLLTTSSLPFLSGAPIPVSVVQKEEQNFQPAAWLTCLGKVC